MEEHDRELIARWNATVTTQDTVWHLGDVCFGGADNHRILSSLNGIKKLVAGNHDTYPSEFYLKYFSRIYGAAELKDCLLTHVPVNENQLKRYAKNIHGHMHSNKIDDPRYVCVSAEHTDYRPKLLSEVIGANPKSLRP